MDVTPLIARDRQVVQSYSGGAFRISGKIYDHPVFLFPQFVERWSFSEDVSELDVSDFSALFPHKNNLDVVLLGTGNRMQFFAPVLKESLKREGLMVDAMDTGAACRTYNVLLAEGRRVACALIPTQKENT